MLTLKSVNELKFIKKILDRFRISVKVRLGLSAGENLMNKAAYLTTSGKKQETREHFADHIKDLELGYCPKVFLLPGEKARDAKVISERLDGNVTMSGVESDKKTLIKLKEEEQLLPNFQVFGGTIDQYTNNALNEAHFDAIWFDFLGGLTRKNIKTAVKFINKKCDIDKDIVLALTLLQTDRYRKNDIEQQFADLQCSQMGNKFATPHNFAGYLASELTSRLDLYFMRPLKAMEYKSIEGKSTPMIYVSFLIQMRSHIMKDF